jgi:predicted nicotinamide N-methyase
MTDVNQILTRLGLLRTLMLDIEPTVEQDVVLNRSGRTYSILRPSDPDVLLDRAEDDPEQNLPYWSEIWPSGVALADAIFLDQSLLAGKRVLELGSGIGITAASALEAGADLIAADYSHDSLLLCRYNTLVNAAREPESLQLNWRSPTQQLFDLAGEGFAVVLAADVLYEERDIAPLLELVDRLVAPDGFLWLAEPGRRVSQLFLSMAGEAGWEVQSELFEGPWPDPKDEHEVVGVHQLRQALGVGR